jgi:hypothetical protein
LSQWLSAGFDEDSFWRKTPRQIAINFKGRASQLTREHNERAWFAHTIASLERSKRIPALKTLLLDERDRKPQSWQDMKAVAKQWTVVLGGDVRPKES